MRLLRYARKGLRLFVLVLFLSASASTSDGAAINAPPRGTADYQSALSGALDYIRAAVPNPAVDSVGGEWAVISLARGGRSDNDWYNLYRSNLEKYIRGDDPLKKAYSVDTATGRVIMDANKYTDNSRVIVALTSIGSNAQTWRSYDLVSALTDTSKTVYQGLNGPIWALIALDTVNYLPDRSDIRAHYLQYILDHEKEGGGWDLRGSTTGDADPDITGMALQSLASYYKMSESAYASKLAGGSAPAHGAVKSAVEKAVVALKGQFTAEGGFAHSMEGQTSESAAQVLTGLCSLNWDDDTFIDAVAENLLTYGNNDGSFRHNADGTGEVQMSTEQAAYALVAYDRYVGKRNSLYDMTDVVMNQEPETDPGTTPGGDSETTPGTDPETDPETTPGTDPDTDPDTDPGTNPDPYPGTDPDDASDDGGTKVIAPVFTPPSGIEAGSGISLVTASELASLGFDAQTAEGPGGAVTVSSSAFASAALSMDASMPITPLPVFRAGVTEGGTALVTFKVSLDSYNGEGIGEIEVLKMKIDGSIERLEPVSDREGVYSGSFVWTDAA